MTTPIHGALPPPKQIRFVNNQGQPPSKRRRINAAYVSHSLLSCTLVVLSRSPPALPLVAFYRVQPAWCGVLVTAVAGISTESKL
jgi:hypothetical protein